MPELSYEDVPLRFCLILWWHFQNYLFLEKIFENMYVFMDSSSLRRWNKQNNNNLEFHTAPRTNSNIFFLCSLTGKYYVRWDTCKRSRQARTYDTSGQNLCYSSLQSLQCKFFFKYVTGPYMLEFTCHTKISAATEQITGPKYIYNLTPFEKLPEFINDTKKFHG